MKRQHELLIDDLIIQVRQSKILKYDVQVNDIKKAFEDGISKRWFQRDPLNEKKLIYKTQA